MRNRRSKRSLFRGFNIDVNPLVIISCIRETVNALLFNNQPVCGAKPIPDMVQQIFVTDFHH